jgi:hypothetical protein
LEYLSSSHYPSIGTNPAAASRRIPYIRKGYHQFWCGVLSPTSDIHSVPFPEVSRFSRRYVVRSSAHRNISFWQHRRRSACIDQRPLRGKLWPHLRQVEVWVLLLITVVVVCFRLRTMYLSAPGQQAQAARQPITVILDVRLRMGSVRHRLLLQRRSRRMDAVVLSMEVKPVRVRPLATAAPNTGKNHLARLTGSI